MATPSATSAGRSCESAASAEPQASTYSFVNVSVTWFRYNMIWMAFSKTSVNSVQGPKIYFVRDYIFVCGWKSSKLWSEFGKSDMNVSLKKICNLLKTLTIFNERMLFLFVGARAYFWANMWNFQINRVPLPATATALNSVNYHQIYSYGAIFVCGWKSNSWRPFNTSKLKIWQIWHDWQLSKNVLIC